MPSPDDNAHARVPVARARRRPHTTNLSLRDGKVVAEVEPGPNETAMAAVERGSADAACRQTAFAEAYHAFLVDGRSFRETAEVAGVPVQTVLEWARCYRWIDRLAAYAKMQSRERALRRRVWAEERAAGTKERQVALAEKLTEKAQRMAENAEDGKDGRADLRVAAEVLSAASLAAERALGVSNMDPDKPARGGSGDEGSGAPAPGLTLVLNGYVPRAAGRPKSAEKTVEAEIVEEE